MRSQCGCAVRHQPSPTRSPTNAFPWLARFIVGFAMVIGDMEAPWRRAVSSGRRKVRPRWFLVPFFDWCVRALGKRCVRLGQRCFLTRLSIACRTITARRVPSKVECRAKFQSANTSVNQKLARSPGFFCKHHVTGSVKFLSKFIFLDKTTPKQVYFVLWIEVFLLNIFTYITGESSSLRLFPRLSRCGGKVYDRR